MARILVVDDEESVRRILGIQLRRMGHEVTEAENGALAWDLIQSKEFEAIITDLKMPEMDGLELLQRVRNHKPQIPVIMITAHGTIDTAVEAMKRGAFDYVTKPFNQDDFLKTVERAVKSADEASKEFQRSRVFLRQEEKIIGNTGEMEKVYAVIEQVANSESNVLITGETGTGKEVVARLLHDKSERRNRPLVRAYLSACHPDEMLDKLFGTSDRQGWIQLAEDGTLYLDEVGALTEATQARLYEALTSGTEIRARVVAASDQNLLEKIDSGAFRKDLFYCLNVVPVYIPPLKDRTQDIEPLVDHFLKIFAKKFDKKVNRIDDQALFHLMQYPWPGNIRELENSIEYAVNVADSPVITEQHLPPHLTGSPVIPKKSWDQGSRDTLRLKMESLEKAAIEEAFKSSGGDLLKASQKLGVPPSMLEEKVKSLKIQGLR